MRLRPPHQGRGPRGAGAPTQYGPRIAAVIPYLYAGQFLPRQRTAQALSELFGIPLSPGTVAAITALTAGKLDRFLGRVPEAIAAMQALASEAISHGHDAVDPVALAAQVHRYRSAALLGARQTAARSSPLMRKHYALARRLLDRQDDYLRFTTDLRAPPDNEAERVIRMSKRIKVSGCMRSMKGAG